MKTSSTNNTIIKKKDAVKSKLNEKSNLDEEIKKILVNQTKTLLENFNRFVKCKSRKNCNNWKGASGSRMKALTINLIKLFDDEQKLRELLKNFDGQNVPDMFKHIISIANENAMKNLEITNDDLDSIANNGYNVLLDQVIKFKDSKNEEERQKVFDEFNQKFGDFIFEKIYKNNNVSFVVDCAKIPEYEYVSDHPSCKINPDNICCYTNKLKSDIEKRSVNDNLNFISDENFKFISDKNLNFISNNNLEMQKLVSQTENYDIGKENNLFKINSFGYLAIFLPIIFVIILVIKKFKK